MSFENDSLSGLPNEELRLIEKAQKRTLASLGLREAIYYNGFGANILKRATSRVKDPGKAPEDVIIKDTGGTLGAVILIDQNNVLVAKGLTARSPRDVMYRLLARVQARGRAIRAFKSSKSSSKINLREVTNINDALMFIEKEYGMKSLFRPNPTDFEAQILAKLSCANTPEI